MIITIIGQPEYKERIWSHFNRLEEEKHTVWLPYANDMNEFRRRNKMLGYLSDEIHVIGDINFLEMAIELAYELKKPLKIFRSDDEKNS